MEFPAGQRSPLRFRLELFARGNRAILRGRFTSFGWGCLRCPAGIRFRLRQTARIFGGVIFDVPEDFPGRPGDNLDVVYRLGENEWNGVTRVELRLVDARLTTNAGAEERAAMLKSKRA